VSEDRRNAAEADEDGGGGDEIDVRCKKDDVREHAEILGYLMP
jgi:hypothetical protein